MRVCIQGFTHRLEETLSAIARPIAACVLGTPKEHNSRAGEQERSCVQDEDLWRER